MDPWALPGSRCGWTLPAHAATQVLLRNEFESEAAIEVARRAARLHRERERQAHRLGVLLHAANHRRAEAAVAMLGKQRDIDEDERLLRAGGREAAHGQAVRDLD